MFPVQSKQLVKSAVVVVLLLLILIPSFYHATFESSLFKGADEAGISYVDESFDRALIAFALARATNAIISVIQDSEINIAPAGIGVTIAIGEALDPVNDMIERFSWVMLVSLVSLGIQKLLIDVSPWISVKFILLPALIMILVGLWNRNNWALRMKFYGSRLVFLAILIRFCIPAMAMVNEQVYRLFLDQHYTTAVAGIEQGNVALRHMSPVAGNLDSNTADSFWSEIRKKAAQVGEVADLQQRINRMKSRLTGMIENLLQMIAVFIMNTIILPIGFLWLLARLFRMITGSDSLQRLEHLLLTKISGDSPPVVPAGGSSEAVHPGRDRENIEINKKDEGVEADQ